MSLKTLRLKRGLTQKEAAEIFGLKYRTYQNYELGNTSPDMDTASLFARYFGCTIGELFDLQEGESEPREDGARRLIELYSKLEPQAKQVLLKIAGDFAEVFSQVSKKDKGPDSND